MGTNNLKTHQINEVVGVCPAITCIISYDFYPSQEPVVRRWSSPLWVLDYTWGLCIPNRVGSVRRPWRVRGSREAHLYPPNTYFWEDSRHGSYTSPGGAFFFRGGEIAGLDKLIPQGQCYVKFHDIEGKLGEILKRLFGLPEQFGDHCFPALQSAMWDVFRTLLLSKHIENEDYAIEDVHRLEKEETFSMRVENYMKKHYREKLTLESIAEALQVSTATLRSKFPKEQKKSPMARLNEIRVDIAKSGLLKSEKASDIASRVGFYDEYHFSKVFKKVTGQSPREFLRSFKT